jgi:hypothetical protein
VVRAVHLRLLILGLSAFIAGVTFFIVSNQVSFVEKVLRDMEKQMAPELPVKLNQQVTLVGVLATSDKTLSATIGVIDETNWESKTKMRQRMANSFCNLESFDRLFELGARLEIRIIKSNDSILLQEFILTREDCTALTAT